MLAVIGGSGLYTLDGLAIDEEYDIDTPFGKPSALVIRGQYRNQTVLFLARHGLNHQYLPHEINYRANIFALKKLGARRVVGISAAGSLRVAIKPGDLALPAQYFDHTRGKRQHTFFGRGIAAHISSAYPTCAALMSDVEQAAKRLKQTLHGGKTYACIEGPRLGTRAESFFLRDAANCDLVGMTNIPEAFLAREAQLAYCTICLITDYDCWLDDPAEHVSVEKFFAIYMQTMTKAKALLDELLNKPFSETPEAVRYGLKNAVLTPDSALTDEQKAYLDVLRA